MTSIAMDEFILQGEGVEAAVRPGVPGDFLDSRAKATVGNMLLHDHYAAMTAKGLSDAIRIERLNRMAGNDGNTFALLRLQASGNIHRHFDGRAIGQDTGVFATLDVADAANLEWVDGFVG